ncbi:pyrroline-5-carboxylate reductase [Kordiimonas pumila]|uniref:Pyrroline-5-carboxylate reductase n=1 Tax=Kordiimonas pumila TaxID=2161677 RepID=A0ABV7D3N4_9PROT|nr:pyrroline-5-carboxylate reductase [Kordiimonas pumila]
MHHVFSAQHPLVLVGFGNMGRALASGWLKAGLPAEALYVADPFATADSFPSVPAANFVKGADALPKGIMARGVILAVKPQIMNTILLAVATITAPTTLIISIAAGVTLNQMQKGIGKPAVYVRSMPNTPAAVGAGITGVTADDISPENQQLALDILSATGSAVWIPSETLMNAVTAVSGSGPAYVFHLVEAMAAAGVKEGLDAKTAMALARQTVIGAGRLMEDDQATEAAELRKRVTSPGGTTAAALDVLMDDSAMTRLLERAIAAASKRGAELAG